MKIQIRKGSLAEHSTEAAVVTLFEGETELNGAAALLDQRSGGQIREIIRMGDFAGRVNQTALLYTRGDLPAKRILVVGLGKRLDFSPERLRETFARAGQRVRSLNITEFSASLNTAHIDLPLEQMAEAVVEGVILGLYRFLPFKTVDREQEVEVATFTILERTRSSGQEPRRQKSSPRRQTSRAISSPRHPMR
jgi:leucyl aminopeptidase